MESPVVHCLQGSTSLTPEFRVILSQDELDMFLLGSVVATVCDDVVATVCDDVVATIPQLLPSTH